MIDETLLARFDRARELEPAQRDRWLEELEANDPAGVRELRSLLAADAIEQSVLERPLHGAPRSDAPALAAADEAEDAPAPVPERIGPYRIVRELGRGGMGRVFLGEQQGEGFSRAVAVKRLDRSEPSAQQARRFRDEVRILSSLEHRGIARFLDGGRDSDGTAYLALEYVEGVDLLSHAAALPLADRLRLFLEVLEAVEFAHQRHVVHRDLKPGNVMVGRDGHPKLLDFGISKLLDPQSVDATATQTEQRALTPAYASPEQICGGAVTVASDVYSLGVMLYELLSGVRPFDRTSKSARELERAIVEEEPEPPSTAARRELLTDRAPSARASLPLAELGRDLDAICLQALQKEPERRYASAREFAADLENYLDGRPVSARCGGVAYRFRKRLRRQRRTLAIALAAAAFAAVAVRVATFLPGRSATAGRPPAAAPARPTLPPIGELSARFAANPNRPELGLELVQALLDAGRGTDAMGAVTRLRQLPGKLGEGPKIDLAEAEAALAVSEYQRAAAVAVAAEEGAGKAGDAALARRARLVHACTLLRLASPEESERRLADLFDEAEAAGDAAIAAECLVARAEAARRAAQTERAPQLLAAGLERARALGLRRVEVQALNLRARLEGESGAVEQGLATVEQSLAIAREIGSLGGEAGGLLLKSALLNWKGDAKTSFEVAELAAARLRETGNREQLLTTLGNLAIIRIEKGEFPEAEAAIAEAETLLTVIATPRARAQILRARAYLQDLRGDSTGSRASYHAAIAAARETGSKSQVAIYLSDLAWMELSKDRFEAAEIAARESLALFEAGGDERAALEVGAVVACAEAARGEAEKARRHIDRLRRAGEESDSESARFLVKIGESKIHEVLGELAAAIEIRREAVRISDGFASPSLALMQRIELAKLLHKAGAAAEASRLARAILPEAGRIGMPDMVRDCRRILGESGT